MYKTISIIFLFISTVFFSCNNAVNPDNSERLPQAAYLDEIIQSDTLRVATMESATTYFLFRDEEAGYDFEMVDDFARYLNVNLKIYVADSIPQMIEWLENKKVNLIAYNLTETRELKEKFRYVYPQTPSHMVVVQSMGKDALSNVTDLSGKTVHVKRNSIFHRRLQQLNDEIGGGINIALHDNNASSHCDLIELVAKDSIDYTIAYSHTVFLYKEYYKRLDGRLAVTFNQKNGWLIPKESEELAQAVEVWSELRQTKRMEEKLHRKYWLKSPYLAQKRIHIPRGAVSPYDDIFKQLAPQIGWDWRLLAALAFQESRFDPMQVSSVGALGVMQLMPQTAYSLGLNDSTVFVAADNIEAGVKYITSLNSIFKKIEDKEERAKFVIAAYNSGPAHILDAMALAEKYGKNPHLWYDNVDEFLLKKNDPEFYEELIVKCGSFRGKETIYHVESVFSIYERYLRRK
jgi:membrane-bound lytic murein transglycosylase F